MFRTLGFLLALATALGSATATRAQTAPDDLGVTGYGDYGVSTYANQPYGGFGLQYSQPVVPGSVVMDQYGLLHGTPSLETAPTVAPAAPLEAARTARSRSRRGFSQPRHQLPTGSLGSAGAGGGILYLPGTRYQSYGNGYGYGPYGVTEYSQMWKGWSLGY